MIMPIMRFDRSQSRAIDHFTGPSLILAGPGSGKTTVITHRIINLIQKYHVPPEKILVATFSKAAASEMEERFLSERKKRRTEVTHPVFGTFHGIFYSFLTSIPGFHAGRIVSDAQKNEILQTALGMAGIRREDALLMQSLSGELNRVKSDLFPDEVFVPSSVPPATFWQIFEIYEQSLAEQDMLDFDDILQKTYELLSHRPDVLTQLQDLFSFFLIDEFQDVSRLQYEIIKLLSSRERNLFAVGDDDQAIYSFRGASSGIMKQFLNDHPDAEKIILHVNYRSVQPIMAASLKVISANKDRFRKNIRCYHAEAVPSAFQLSRFPSSKEEMASICDRIQEHLKQGIPSNQIAILSRSSLDHAFIRDQLLEQKISVRGSNPLRERIRKDLLKDLSCYMRTASGNCSRKDLLQIINRPSRFISRKAFDGVPENSSEWLQTVAKYYAGNPVMEKRIEELERHLLFLGECAPYAAISYIWNAIGYRDYIRVYCMEHRQNYADYEQAFSDILEGSKKMASFRQWEEWQREMTEQSGITASSSEGVSVMTMHASKGLEYDVVFLPGLNEGRMPHKKAVTGEAIREERRLLYVAMTRAKKHLYLSFVENYRSKKATPSRFLDCFFQ